MGGTDSSRWVSLASIGLPVAVWVPLTTQLLLPRPWRISRRDSSIQLCSEGQRGDGRPLKGSVVCVVGALALLALSTVSDRISSSLSSSSVFARERSEPSLATLGSPTTK